MLTCWSNSTAGSGISVCLLYRITSNRFLAAELIWERPAASSRGSGRVCGENAFVSPWYWRERVQDILDAIAEIRRFTNGMDFDSFSTDARTLKAVEFNLIVIGEAANQIPAGVEESHPQIPWPVMRAMRNRLVHVYFSVDERLLWDTVQNDLPGLFSALRSLLN